MELNFIGIFEILLTTISFILLRRLYTTAGGLPTNFPVIGMLPALISNTHRIYDWVTDLLSISNCTFHFKGPRFSSLNIMLTSDPPNIHHIMTSSFGNFPKGEEFRMVFDILGDGIFNADGDTWRDQRRLAMSLITHREFYKFLKRTSAEKVEGGLVPLLRHVAETGSVVDLQVRPAGNSVVKIEEFTISDVAAGSHLDVFERYTFDSICKLVIGFDPGCLSSEFPEVPFAKALDDAEEAIFYRHVVPETVWKLQRWLGVGEEGKLSRAWKTMDMVTWHYIEKKREEIKRCRDEETTSGGVDEGTDLLTSYIGLGYNDDRYLRDTIVNLLLAGRDTTSSALTWFFWSLWQHPIVVTKIREELNSIDAITSDSINKLVYLHAAICESLRLYPPVPWEHKKSTKPDILPSGHRVDPTMKIVFSLYAMGRMPLVWGDDCLDFRPERWIKDNNGGIRHEPAYKFMAFNAGPRTCLGKEVAFVQMKIVAANVIKRFDIEVVNSKEVKPSHSIILHMKSGLKVKVIKRD